MFVLVCQVLHPKSLQYISQNQQSSILQNIESEGKKMEHRCGGELLPSKVEIKKKVGSQYYKFIVDGYQCDRCGEEIITGDKASEIDQSIEWLKQLIKENWKDWNIISETVNSGVRLSPQSELIDVKTILEDSNYLVPQLQLS